MVREVQQAGQGAGPRRPAPLRGVEQPARAERHGPPCLRHDGRDDLGADETTWSCDGLRGYIYGFFTDDIALFRFRGTRRKFVPKFVDLLREAMKLRSRDIPDDKYYDEARRIKAAMLKMIDAQARDAGLQKYQDIYRRHPDRSFQWAEDRRVPAENNMSERGVRRTVIARKTCGGSQSEDALMVREVLQSVIGSLRLRCGDPVARLTEALDAYALDKTFMIEDFLFPLQKA